MFLQSLLSYMRFYDLAITSSTICLTGSSENRSSSFMACAYLLLSYSCMDTGSAVAGAAALDCSFCKPLRILGVPVPGGFADVGAVRTLAALYGVPCITGRADIGFLRS